MSTENDETARNWGAYCPNDGPRCGPITECDTEQAAVEIVELHQRYTGCES